MRKTKIICTIGPATDDPEVLRELMRSGMNVARLNFSHGNHEEQLERVNRIKAAREELNLPVAIMLDTKGPEIRTGVFENDRVTLETGSEVTIYQEDRLGNAAAFSTTYKNLANDLEIGSRILIDDGLIELVVKGFAGADVVCTVKTGGEVANHKSINLPGVNLHLPALTEKDELDLAFAVEHEFDFIAASFIRKPSDVMEIRRVLHELGDDSIRIVAKIENQEGVDNYVSIIEVSDGIMVARGDLGVEIPAHVVPSIQKKLVQTAYHMGKPSITATQMLDSMIRNPRPTRAEASDVANAVLDGASAVMLSGETAIGKYPLESIRMMEKILSYTESSIDYWDEFRRSAFELTPNVANAVSHACCMTAMDLNAKAIITVTHSGRTARLISRFRPECPIIATTVTQRSCYQLALSWGVIPMLIDVYENTDELFEESVKVAQNAELVENGDIVVISCGTPVGMSGTTNTLKVENVGAVLGRGTPVCKNPELQVSGNVLLARDIETISDQEQLVKDQDFILVAEQTAANLLPWIRKAKAVIVEDKSATGHAIATCQALEIPLIYGCENLTQLVKTGQQVVMDFATGIVG